MFIINKKAKCKMIRPKIKIKYQTIDYIIELLGIIGIVCLIVIPIYFYNDLPDILPIHFNIKGQPDAFGSKDSIWILPSIGLFLYIGMTLLNRIPHFFNYPTKFTNKNAERLYTTETRTLRLFKVIVVLLFAYIDFQVIRIGLKESTELGVLFIPLIILILIVIVWVMVYKKKKKKL